MKLKHTKEVKIIVDYNDLEAFIEEIYGHEYEIVSMEEWNNSESHTFNIKGERIDDYNMKYITFLEKGNPKQYSLRVILIDMCNNGYIEEGNYLINISW